MKVIKNIDTHDLKVPFEGKTYLLPQDKAVEISGALFNFLEERFPLSFDFKVVLGKTEKVKEAAFEKTRIYTPVNHDEADERGTDDMQIKATKPRDSFGIDDLPVGTDRDGVDWYGAGLQVEGGS